MKYLHKNNKDLQFIDWRDKPFRRLGFVKWLDWRLSWNDLDHYMYAQTYSQCSGKKSPTGKPMDEEQKLWYSLIFGCTYQTEMAWVIYWAFPDFHKINISEMKDWSDRNYDKQKYARDTKYNKGKISEQVASMQKIVNKYGSIKKWLEDGLVESEHKSFQNIFKKSQEIYKFGRMSGWLFCQALYEIVGLPIRPDNMLATDPSNWSVRSGLFYLFGEDEKIKAKLDKSDMEQVAQYEYRVYHMCMEFLSEKNKSKLTNFLLESHLCQYKKLMLGGDYAGHSTGDHFSRGSELAEKWPEVNFDSFFEDCISKQNPLVQKKYESVALRNMCTKTGQLINMHSDSPSMPDMYLEMGIEHEWLMERRKHEKKINKCIDEYKRKMEL